MVFRFTKNSFIFTDSKLDVMQTLQDAKIGEVRTVSDLKPSPLKAKLTEMGFYVGKEVELLYKAPFGDPIAVRVGDYVLSMRKSEALLIGIE
jgi:ferrous iron transport protein A